MHRSRSHWNKLLLLGILIALLLYLLPNALNSLVYTALSIVCGIGLILAIISLPYSMKQARKSDLCGKGNLVKAKIVKVITGKSPQQPSGLGRLYRLNPKLYHYLKCEYIHPKTKKVYVFYSWSHFVGPDPSPFLPKTVDVWVDPKDWKNYYVDLGILPDDILRGYAPVINK